MTETRARFCDVCGKLVDKQRVVYRKSEWQDKYSNTYWRSQDNKTIVCIRCWEPLHNMAFQIRSEDMMELCAWVLLYPDKEDIYDS